MWGPGELSQAGAERGPRRGRVLPGLPFTTAPNLTVASALQPSHCPPYPCPSLDVGTTLHSRALCLACAPGFSLPADLLVLGCLHQEALCPVQAEQGQYPSLTSRAKILELLKVEPTEKWLVTF